jgi:hypothetical protein
MVGLHILMIVINLTVLPEYKKELIKLFFGITAKQSKKV